MTSAESNDFHFAPAMVALCGFGLGIILDRSFDFSWQLALGMSIGFLTIWCAWTMTKQNALVGAFLLLTAIVFAGAFWHHGRWNWFPVRDLASYCQRESQPACVRARILGEAKYSARSEDERLDPLPKRERTTFLIEPTEIRNGQKWERTYGKSRLIVHQKVEGISFGDDVLIIGGLVPIRKPTSPGQFDFQNYFRAKQLTSSIHVFHDDSVIVQRSSSPFSNAAVLSRLRMKLNDLIWQYVDPENAGFASAILLGNREQLTQNQRQAFIATGTAHLLAISGLHLGILASMFLFLYRFGFLNRRWALFSTIVFVVFYAWLVEFRPPVTRAAILLLLFCSGRLIGRTGFEFNLLAIAGILVLTLNPNDLFSLGPQLSFLAVGSLIVFKSSIFPPLSNDPIDRLIRSTRPWHVRFINHVGRRCKQAILVSGLIWMLGLPLVAANYHLVTPVALIVNPIVLLPIAVALFGGLGICVFGSWLPPAADFFAALNSSSLQLVTRIIEYAESLEWGHWWTAGPLPLSIAIFYVLLSIIAVVSQPQRVKFLFLIAIAWVSLGWLLPFQVTKLADSFIDNQRTCTFIDMGHGSCTFFKMSDGKTLLCDAGSMSSASFAATTISNVLWSEQIEHIDAVIISHADLDHYNAVPELVRRFSIGAIYISLPMSEKKDETVAGLFDELQAADIPVRALARNDRAELPGGETIGVLLPPDSGTDDNDNSDSIVLLIEVGGEKILLPGDLEENGMQLLLAQDPVDCDVAILPHHGSKNSSPTEFISWSRPELVVVSAGRSKTDRKVIQRIEQLDCRVFPTGDFGSMRMIFDDDTIRVFKWSNGTWVPIKFHRS